MSDTINSYEYVVEFYDKAGMYKYSVIRTVELDYIEDPEEKDVSRSLVDA